MWLIFSNAGTKPGDECYYSQSVDLITETLSCRILLGLQLEILIEISREFYIETLVLSRC